MTITAVRLKPIDRTRNFGMRSYVSANSRTKYTSGSDQSPSPFRVINNDAEAVELSAIPQFELLEFDDMDHLREVVQAEMESRARVGLPAVRASVLDGPGIGRSVVGNSAKPRRAVIDRLPAAATTPASDPTKTHKGRQPTAEKALGEDSPGIDEKQAEAAEKPAPKSKPKSKPKARTKGKKGQKKRNTRPASDEE